VFSNQKKKMRNWYINGWQTNYPGELMQLYWTSTNNETELWTHPNVEVNTDRIWDRAGRRDLKYLIGNFRPNIVITDFAERRKAKYILKHAYWAFPV
jgi:hypothetical protein